ncbi:MAG: hypothetical protein Q8P01_05390 [bacterium]|nr:hypothetical protein [bacterium]
MAKESSQKKIFLEAGDDVDVTVGRFAEVSGKEVVVNIPRGSVLGGSVKNFRFLQKKALEQGKLLSIESVDDHVLELAEVADIRALNPVFQTKGKAVVDIVPGGGVRHGRVVSDASEEIEKVVEEEETPVRVQHFWDRDEKLSLPRRKVGVSFSRGLVVRFAVVLILLVGVSFVAAKVLPKATVALRLERYPIPVAQAVKVDTKTSTSSLVGETVFLAGELLTATKNMEKSFPASGTEQVERKAAGKLTIYNEFSSKPQVLVRDTRFETPDGKIYRLVQQVTVPGAGVEGGGIKTSSVEAEVYADKVGESYNIGPVLKFTIPGFSKDPARFKGFYARSFESMKGGYVGVQAAPTDKEVAAAKEEVKRSLLDALQGEISILMKEDFEVLKDTTSFEVLRDEVYLPSSAELTFSIFMEARLHQFVFDRGALQAALVSRAREAALAARKEKGLAEDVDLRVDKLSFEYSNVSFDPSAERMELMVNGEVVFTTDINTSTLTAQLLGKSAAEVKQAILKLPGLDNAHVSLWSFWVKKVPGDEGKVKIEVE